MCSGSKPGPRSMTSTWSVDLDPRIRTRIASLSSRLACRTLLETTSLTRSAASSTKRSFNEGRSASRLRRASAGEFASGLRRRSISGSTWMRYPRRGGRQTLLLAASSGDRTVASATPGGRRRGRVGWRLRDGLGHRVGHRLRNGLGWRRRTGLRWLRWLGLRLRLASHVPRRVHRRDHRKITSMSRSLRSSRPKASHAHRPRRARARSSCALDILERPSIPRSFASS